MKEKNIHAVKLGRLGGRARFLRLTPQRRKEISLMGVKKRRENKQKKGYS